MDSAQRRIVLTHQEGVVQELEQMQQSAWSEAMCRALAHRRITNVPQVFCMLRDE